MSGDEKPKRYVGADRPLIDRDTVIAVRNPGSGAVLVKDFVAVQPMTAPVEGFEVHVMTPEEIAESAKTRLWVRAFCIASPDDAEPWTPGRLRLSRLEDGGWDFGFWRDAPPLTDCLPVQVGTIVRWGTNRSGLYAPVPEGYTMITLDVAPPSSAVRFMAVFAVPADREAEIREKVQPPPLPDPGPKYGA